VSLAAILTLLGALVLSIALLGAVVAAVWWFDRYDREPVHLVMAVFLWGASVAPAMAVLFFSFFGRIIDEWLSFDTVGLVGVSVIGPLVEECAKGAGILLIVILTSKFDNPTDGVVYGSAVGLGFAVTENVLYAMAAGTHMAGWRELMVLIGGRTLMSAGVHAVSSSIFGGCVGHAILNRRRIVRLAWCVCGVLAASAAHGSWNLALSSVGPFAPDGSLRAWLAILPLVYLAYVAVMAFFLHSEHRILKRQLGEEVALALAPGWVEQVIPYYRRRIRSDWWPSRRERTVISRLLTRIAFRKHALRHLPPNEAAIASLEVVRLRQRLRQILGPTEINDG
jgi:RsiW-degrading membrane proteinase PrsW (M82 family)